MKKWLAILLLLVVTPSMASEWAGDDKKLHAKYGAVIGGGSVLMLNFIEYEGNRPLAASLVCSAGGLFKEISDERSYGGFDGKDLIVTVAFCFVGAYVVHEGLNVGVVPIDGGVLVSARWTF